MKHKPVIIAMPDLFNRVERDSDDFSLADALGINDAPDASDWDAYSAWQLVYLERHDADYAVVSWPENVLNPKYNADAYYAGPMSLGQAREEAPDAEVYV